MKRKSPVHHKVRSHTRQGKQIKSFERGRGIHPKRSPRVVRGQKPKEESEIVILVKQLSPQTVVTVSPSGRRYKFIGPNKEGYLWQGVVDKKWRVKYSSDPHDRQALTEQFSTPKAGALELLKWVDNKYNERVFRELSSIAEEGEE